MKAYPSQCPTFVLFIIGLLAMFPAMMAQEAGAPPAGAAGAQAGTAGVETKVQDVAQILNLSDQQKSQLEPIVKEEAPKVQAIVHDPNLTNDEKAKKLETVHKQTDSLVKSILTPVQYKQWGDIRKLEVERLKSGAK